MIDRAEILEVICKNAVSAAAEQLASGDVVSEHTATLCLLCEVIKQLKLLCADKVDVAA